MSITIDRYTEQVIGNVPKPYCNKKKHNKTVWYNRVMPRLRKRIIHCVKTMFENREYLHIYWITFTTQQHKTGLPDEYFSRCLEKWLKNRGPANYVVRVERQELTQDIHFHMLFETDTFYFDLNNETDKWSKYCEVESHPAMFDIKEVTQVGQLGSYLSKYITKQKRDFCSIYTTRVFRCSKGLSKKVKATCDKYRIKLDDLQSIDFKKDNNLISKKDTEFARLYQFSNDLWIDAKRRYNKRNPGAPT